ncbi:MAG: hypothetical protein JSR65_10665 [Proteobacteria bacterium]|nr:hypothetical protein [Pseudomonadota bacterium]
MKRFSLLCFAPLLLAFSPCVFAQDAKPYKDGPVVDVTFIKTRPGQFDNYMKFLDGPYKKLMEAQKKAGLILGYKVFTSEPRSPHDADVILSITFANMAALDKTDEADAVSAKVLGSSDDQNKATIERGPMRDVLGSQLMREMILK